MTAVDRVDRYRLDHQGFVPEIFAGLLLTSLYMMQVGPSIPNLSDYLEDWLALTLFGGSALGLLGVVVGTKWFFKKLPRKVAYIIELVALPLMIFSLAWYTYASVDTVQLLMTALAGGLGLCIEIGLVRLTVDIVEDLNTDHSEHDHD